jgi:hypothetical protein
MPSGSRAMRPYEPMGASYEDALASDLPGIS